MRQNILTWNFIREALEYLSFLFNFKTVSFCIIAHTLKDVWTWPQTALWQVHILPIRLVAKWKEKWHTNPISLNHITRMTAGQHECGVVGKAYTGIPLLHITCCSWFDDCDLASSQLRNVNCIWWDWGTLLVSKYSLWNPAVFIDVSNRVKEY